MKKIRNCKAILALAICLTMFAGLAVTVSAANMTCCGRKMTYTGKESVWCSTCGKVQVVEIYKCSLYPKVPGHTMGYCPFHKGTC